MQVTWSGFYTSISDIAIKEIVPEQAGIYLFWVKLTNDKWRCFYAGQAENLQERLLTHISENEENDCLKEKISIYITGYEFAVVEKPEDRNGIEKYLFDYYTPQCNKQDPGGNPTEINLP